MNRKQKRWAVVGQVAYFRTCSEEESFDSTENIQAMAKFVEALEEGRENINSFRVMIIGCFEQGKTSLVNSLLGKSDAETKATNGIEIHKCMGNTCGDQWIEKPATTTDDEVIHRMVSVAKYLPTEKTNMAVAANSPLRRNFSYNPHSKANKHNAPTTKVQWQQGNDVETQIEVLKRNDIKVRSKSEEYTRSFPSHFYHKFSCALKQDKALDDELAGIQIWDFGGEFVFYATHQLFLCRQAVYLLVFRLDISLDDVIPDNEYPGNIKPHLRSMREYIEFWLSSVHTFVGDDNGKTPKVILVGTHKDKLSNPDDAEEYFESIRKLLEDRLLKNHIYRDCFAVSSIDQHDQNIPGLRNAIMHIFEEQIKMNKIPAKWIPLENALGKCKDKDLITFEEVVHLDEQNSKIGRQEVHCFLQHHHDIGTLFYIPDGSPVPYVILNPEFIVDAFKCIITSKKFFSKEPRLRLLWTKLSEKAVLDPELLEIVWNEPRFCEHKNILQECLIKLRIIGNALLYKADNKFLPQDFFIVPSLLPSCSNVGMRAFLRGKKRTFVSLLYEFVDEAILPTIYQRITAAALGTWPILRYKGSDLLFTNCCAYKLNAVHSGLIKHEGNRLEILVIQLCTDTAIDSRVSDYFRRFVEYSIQEIMNHPGKRTQHSVSKRFKCMDEIHGENGTIDSYDLESLNPNENVSCPDHESHRSISMTEVLKTWFGVGDTPADDKIPERQLKEIEMVKLTEAIGENWQLLGMSLGVHDIYLQHIKEDNHTEATRIFRMLKHWDEEMCGRATLRRLIRELRLCRNVQVNWDIVRNIIDGLY